VTSLKNHIKQLSSKNYADIADLNTLGFVVMFVPVEGALMTALQHEPGLLEQAYNQNVIPLSASGLLVTLRTVMRLWQIEKQNKNSIFALRINNFKHIKTNQCEIMKLLSS
jgi:DNA recombination protein RmuC